jgi:hypothetical protein
MPTVIYELMGGVVTTLPASPPPLTSDTAPTTLAEFHGQNAWSQAVINTTGGNVSVDPGIGRRLYTIVANVAAPGLAGSTFTITANGTAVVLTAGVSFVLGVDDTAPQLAVTATNLAAAINANVTLGPLMVAVPLTQFVYLNLNPACDGCTIATNAAGADATSTSGTDGQFKIGSDFGMFRVGASGMRLTNGASTANAGSLQLYQLTTAQSIETLADGIYNRGQAFFYDGAGYTMGLTAAAPGTLTVTDGAAGVGRLWVGGDTVGGLGMIAAMNAGWGSP